LSGGISALQKMLQRRKYRPRPAMSDVAVSMLTASDKRPLAINTNTVPPKQLPNLGRSLTSRQSGQAAPQARNYHWIGTWQVLLSACTNLNI